MKRLLTLLALLVPAFAQAFDPFGLAGIDLRPGAAVPLDEPFLDARGALTSLRILGHGHPILLVPVLHDCPNICGITLSGLAQAVRAQPFRPGSDFELVALGIDPKEGPGQAAASLDKLAASAAWLPRTAVHGLTGSEESIRAVTDPLGYRYAWDRDIGQYAHVAATAVLTTDGRLSRWLYGLSPDPRDLRLALVEAGEGRIGQWTDQLLLLCYHYDPKTGRYGPLAWWMLRAGGGATLAVLGGLIAYALIRERRARKARA